MEQALRLNAELQKCMSIEQRVMQGCNKLLVRLPWVTLEQKTLQQQPIYYTTYNY